jgi:hypothetical protein
MSMSLALNRLQPEQRKQLKERLWHKQGGVCFITQKQMDLSRDDLEIDHVVPTRDKGPDDESNWALVFARANESKQASHLYVARVLNQLETIRENAQDARGANLGDVLRHFGGAKHPLNVRIANDLLHYKLT